MTAWFLTCSVMPRPAQAPPFRLRRETMTKSVKIGLYRTVLPGIGECARVDMRAGDAAPYLDRDMYESLGFEPPFDSLAYKPDNWPRKKS
jgi:hypothetical protein